MFKEEIWDFYLHTKKVDVLATVDDDNIPFDNWGTELFVNEDIDVDIYTFDNDFVSLSVTNHNDLCIGYPIELVPPKIQIILRKRKVLVQADCDGDP